MSINPNVSLLICDIYSMDHNQAATARTCISLSEPQRNIIVVLEGLQVVYPYCRCSTYTYPYCWVSTTVHPIVGAVLDRQFEPGNDYLGEEPAGQTVR